MQAPVYTSGAVTGNSDGGFSLLSNLRAKLAAKEQEQARLAEMERLLSAEGLPSELPEEPAFCEQAVTIDTVSMDATAGFRGRMGNRGRDLPGGTVSGAHIADRSDEEAEEPAEEGVAQPLAEPLPGRILGVRVLEVLADLRERGHAVAVGRTLSDLTPEVLEAAYALADSGYAHLWAEADGIVLATANSTMGDRRRAVEALPEKPAIASHRPATELRHLPDGGGTVGCWPNLLLSLGELHFSGGEDHVRAESFRVLPESARLTLPGEEVLADEELRAMGAPERAAYARARAAYLERTTVRGVVLPFDHNLRAEILAADEAFRAARFRKGSAPSGFDVRSLRAHLADAHLEAARSERARADADYERHHEEAAEPGAVAKEAARLMALSDSFFKKAELTRMRENAARMREGVVNRLRSGQGLVVTPAAGCAPELTARGREDAARRARGAASSCGWVSPQALEEAAWRTAGAIALGRLDRYPALWLEGDPRPAEEPHLRLARKALHLIRREGGTCKVSHLHGLAKAEARRPEQVAVSWSLLLRAALEELRRSGAVRALRDPDGDLAAEATKKLDRRAYGYELLRVIADPKNRIPVPPGSRLERRLKGYEERRREARAEERAARKDAPKKATTPQAAAA